MYTITSTIGIQAHAVKASTIDRLKLIKIKIGKAISTPMTPTIRNLKK